MMTMISPNFLLLILLLFVSSNIVLVSAQSGECRAAVSKFCPQFVLPNGVSNIVNSAPSCEAACRICEGSGFTCGQLETKFVDGTEYYQCQCAMSDCTSDLRVFCQDELFSGAFSVFTTTWIVTATVGLLMTVFMG